MKIKRIIVGPLMTNCYLVISDNELLIIDPGDEPGKILKEISAQGGSASGGKKTKAEPKYIILTHYHFDHILAAETLKEKTGAKILIHEADKNFLKFSANQYLKEGDKIKIGKEYLKIIHSPGHTQGSICLLSKNEIFSGDLIFEDGYGRTDLLGGSEKDLKNSLKKISKLLKEGTMIYPGHGKEFKYKK